MSIALAWSECKTYGEEIGPGRAEPPQPERCLFCDGDRVWRNGWRRVWPTLVVDGRPHRPADGIALRRVRCARRECRRSWTLRPPWLYPHRSLEPDVAEAAALAYVREPATSYAAVAAAFGCAWITVWRWVGWLADLVAPAALISAAARLGGTGGAEPALVPRAVPAAARARSSARATAVRTAAQVLASLAVVHRAQPEPPADPSPLRWWLLGEFLAFRHLALLTRRSAPRR
jgi:hypothetical protein